jgi:glycosyltransferase involved in cell wall biosynthesis
LELVVDALAVIMSVYKNDRPDYLFESLESLFLQDVVPDVFLIADGFISDELLSTVQSFEMSGAPLYFIRRSANLGLASSLNELIDIVLSSDRHYEFIARMDSDDICDLSRFRLQIEYLNNNINIDVLGTACIEFSTFDPLQNIKTLPLLDEDLKSNIIRRCPFVHPSVIFRRRVFQSTRYPTGTALTEDYAMWIELARKGFVFGNLPDPLIRYRFDPGVFIRRRGWLKGYHECLERLKAMRTLNRYAPLDFAYAFGFFFLRVVPPSIAKYMYRTLRS